MEILMHSHILLNTECFFSVGCK